jgi:hypothetical protein
MRLTDKTGHAHFNYKLLSHDVASCRKADSGPVHRLGFSVGRGFGPEAIAKAIKPRPLRTATIVEFIRGLHGTLSLTQPRKAYSLSGLLYSERGDFSTTNQKV